MQAAVVIPGRPESARVEEIQAPEPTPSEVLVRTEVIGLDATDREVAEGYGELPPEADFMVVGHEALGVVEVTGADVNDLSPGDLAVPIVRRPDPVPCANCARGEWDMCLNGRFTERGIKGRHGFCSELFVESPDYLVPLPEGLDSIGVLIEPLSIVEKAIEQTWRIQERLRWEPRTAAVLGAGPIGLLAAMALVARGVEVAVYDRSDQGPRRSVVDGVGAEFVLAEDDGDLRGALPWPPDLVIEATGYSPLALQAVDALAPAGVACLTGVSSGTRVIHVDADSLNLEMVLENKVVFGTVNANRRHFEAAASDLVSFEERWPGLTAALITRRLPLDRFAEGLEKTPDDIKVVVDVAP